MADRIIFHCDLNCFFASVELLDKPALQNVPVAVCGDPASRHGIILAKNEPAKQMGIQTAETVWQAKQKCPHLVLLPPHHSLYADYSRRVNAIYGQYTDLVEPFGIDESWLDVTGSLHLFGGDARQLKAKHAHDVRAGIRQVVHSVRHNRNRSRQHANCTLRSAKRNIGENTHYARQRSHARTVALRTTNNPLDHPHQSPRYYLYIYCSNGL